MTNQVESPQPKTSLLNGKEHSGQDHGGQDNHVNTPNWMGLYQDILSIPLQENNDYISNRIKSDLMYLVLENELSMQNKRRIVMLNSHDLLYASTSGKCVFLPINWEQDFTNAVKVHEGNVIWETTFGELVLTHPVSLQNLFSRSEIWAEGKYDALA